MNLKEISTLLETQYGYRVRVRVIDGQFIAVIKFAYTWGLCYGVDEHGYKGRYCYTDLCDCYIAFDEVSKLDADNPPDDSRWLKHKGLTEFSNPNFNNEKG